MTELQNPEAAVPENGKIPDAYMNPQAFYHFNVQMHGGSLLVYLITLQREKRTVGYFSASRFIRRSGEKTVEIGMNAAFFAERSIRETLSALAHDIVHQWRFRFGMVDQRGYYDRE